MLIAQVVFLLEHRHIHNTHTNLQMPLIILFHASATPAWDNKCQPLTNTPTYHDKQQLLLPQPFYGSLDCVWDYSGVLDLLKQETVSGSGISWAICKSAPRPKQITTPASHHSVFYRPDALSITQPTESKH